MAFCTNCGARMEGQFCVQCGAKAGAEPPPSPVPPVSPAPAAAYSAAPPPAAPPSRGKGKLLVWVLAGCGGLLVLGLIAVFGLGLFISRKASEFGDNPGFAAAKMLASMNPDVDVVKADEKTGRITLREKKTGKTVTLDFRDIQKGRISFEGEDGERVDIDSEGEAGKGSMTVKSRDGTMQWGATTLDNVPGWVPRYPGGQALGSFAMQGKDGDGGSFQLKCDGSVQRVADFYEQALKGSGMKVDRHSVPSGGKSTVILSASGGNRSVNATIDQTDEGTVAAIIYSAQD